MDCYLTMSYAEGDPHWHSTRHLFLTSKFAQRPRTTSRVEHYSKTSAVESISSPEISDGSKRGHVQLCPKEQLEAGTASESRLSVRNNEVKSDTVRLVKSPPAEEQMTSPGDSGDTLQAHRKDMSKFSKIWKDPKETSVKSCMLDKAKYNCITLKKTRAVGSPLLMENEEVLSRQIRDIHNETRKSSRIIRDSRARLFEIQKKTTITETEVRELGERSELLLREMERFDQLTKSLQRMVGSEGLRKQKDCTQMEYIPGSIYEPPLHHEMKMAHPAIVLTGERTSHPQPIRSKSEIDLTRKLSECYDMQEKLVADNADLEVKSRKNEDDYSASEEKQYILYKELMTKDQNLETCRAQVKRLQGELKLMGNENATLQEKLNKINLESGDAAAIKNNSPPEFKKPEINENAAQSDESNWKLVEKLEKYKSSSLEIEKVVEGLEVEVRQIQLEMDKTVKAACRGGGEKNTCYAQQPGGPPVPPMTRACGVCPPCPAPCNPNAPPTPAEKEVQRLTVQLRQTEENFKTKVTECAMLRSELMKKKDELEKERCQHREVQNKLRELEMKFEGLATHTNMLLGTKEQALEQEVNVRALKQCYREAREEIAELRTLMKEQNDQLQDYRVKYLQAQQLVEEQRRQMDLMDMDNTRISEQINLEIQRVKLKFQEKLQELAPIPDLLKATQARLKDAQQSQAIAEHNAEQLARELNCAREKVHVLLHNSMKPPEKPDRGSGEEKQMQMLQQRITQLTEINTTLKTEIERLKLNVIRMEESVLANEKRLQEKMHECAALGGELDRARDEAARAIQRSNDRLETMRKCLQTTVADLERQLASSRAQVKTSEKEREEIQARMNCQIKRLNDNFEQAQLRILGLQTQVQTLRRTASSTGEGDGEPEPQECACKSFFDEP